MAPSNPQNNNPLKRRACDECRTRKLACSKEPDGCTRCVRENIRCHYSEQKPMGRPRKRQANGEMRDGNSDFRSMIPDFDQLPYFDDNFELNPFADTNGLDLNDITDYPALPSEQAPSSGLCTFGDGRAVFHFGDDELNVPIDFGPNDLGSDSADTIVQSTHEPVKLPHTVFAGDYPAPTSPGPPCSCLASMYLAMSSLQEFPVEFEAALATVRSAASTTQSCIRCQKCGHFVVTSVTPSIEAFQNTMLIGTILPIIANSYKRLLVMVNDETEKAKALGVKKVFKISNYGGMCGQDKLCDVAKHLKDAAMEPDDWRAALRGLLRADVYGMEGITTGLRGLIEEVEQRQRTRHEELHQIQQNGLSPHDIGNRDCLGEKDILCIRILDTAKVSIDTLVIA